MKPFWFVDQQDSVFRINCQFEIEGKVGSLIEFLPDRGLGNAAHNEAIIAGTIEYMTRRKNQFLAGAKDHG